jgi:hypothetical protein
MFWYWLYRLAFVCSVSLAAYMYAADRVQNAIFYALWSILCHRLVVSAKRKDD